MPSGNTVQHRCRRHVKIEQYKIRCTGKLSKTSDGLHMRNAYTPPLLTRRSHALVNQLPLAGFLLALQSDRPNETVLLPWYR